MENLGETRLILTHGKNVIGLDNREKLCFSVIIEVLYILKEKKKTRGLFCCKTSDIMVGCQKIRHSGKYQPQKLINNRTITRLIVYLSLFDYAYVKQVKRARIIFIKPKFWETDFQKMYEDQQRTYLERVNEPDYVQPEYYIKIKAQIEQNEGEQHE